MKLSVIVGVSHMLYGICISLLNHMYSRYTHLHIATHSRIQASMLGGTSLLFRVRGKA